MVIPQMPKHVVITLQSVGIVLELLAVYLMIFRKGSVSYAVPILIIGMFMTLSPVFLKNNQSQK
jgi:hypothetical protein